ncbi:unnamed protein product [Rangifer tarandus platyrhynchus]|uniref:Uncharacterized protein n=1 Tax=Rangifer tarandus platyrhynchus TaxID=3082113 RepID=A0ABN8ZWN4_RANTA|nr:unnamed protein product [Rangifer tarandus platyrhynchus]
MQNISGLFGNGELPANPAFRMPEPRAVPAPTKADQRLAGGTSTQAQFQREFFLQLLVLGLRCPFSLGSPNTVSPEVVQNPQNVPELWCLGSGQRLDLGFTF